MSEGCSHDCENCSSKGSCSAPQVEAPNANSEVKSVIAVVSGKGGVGKSSVASLLASCFQKSGKSVAVLDADITGPSIPKAFGVGERLVCDETGIYPAETPSGIKIVSLNLMVDDETDPVVWRGPMIAGCVKQFWTDVNWGAVDVMVVDCPPGTGDVPLTLFQSLPIKGIVVVTSPQDLVSMIVEKAVKMAKAMKIPVLGVVENMAYYVCPDCKKKHFLFGESKLSETAKICGVENAVSMPVQPELAKLFDDGRVEEADVSYLRTFADTVLKDL